MATHLKSPAAVARAAAEGVRETVATVIADVRGRGDAAVREYSEKFDNWSPGNVRLSADDIDRIVATVPARAVDDITAVQARVRGFAQRQTDSLQDFEVETEPGVRLGQRHISGAGRRRLRARWPVPARRVGPHDRRHREGRRGRTGRRGHAADPRRDPGRDDRRDAPGRHRRDLFGEVGIDLFAGPTEILVVADDAADPSVVAVDLVSQAEHGPARRDHGKVVVVDDLAQAYALADGYAFEHVQVLTREPREALSAMRDYGALFLGEATCVSAPTTPCRHARRPGTPAARGWAGT